jgi:uncharacterized protein
VGGPTRDFNLMALPGRSRMQRVRGGVKFPVDPGMVLALYTHGTGAHLDCDGQLLDLPPYHLAWSRAAGRAAADVQAQDALWMEVQA